ncbi:MAG TPA: hypothetical protein VFC19_27965 [Candidatus Limnocylindrales bacterium]|nr:hypothetical protein [Candidatus Limnocylindrales bacterium]
MRASVLALVLFAVAGCTSGGSPDTAATPSGSVGVWRQFVTCARANGQANWPDPVVDANTGKATFPAVAGFEEKTAFEAVRDKCASILDSLPPQANPLSRQGVSPEKLQVLREYAQCLRENGLPETIDPQPDGTWPDGPEPPGGWPTDLGQRRAQAFEACDPIYEPRLRQ